MSYDVPPGPPPDLSATTPAGNLLIVLGLAAVLAVAVVAFLRHLRRTRRDGAAGS